MASLNRRSFMQTALAGSAAAQAGRAQENRPNVFWICSDQQRWDTIHALGTNRIRTPKIDRLVQEGVAFTNAYCQNPVCTRDGRYKLVVYHGHEAGELYDLAEDPEEFYNLWDDHDRIAEKNQLIGLLFDDVIRTYDLGAPRIGPM